MMWLNALLDLLSRIEYMGEWCVEIWLARRVANYVCYTANGMKAPGESLLTTLKGIFEIAKPLFLSLVPPTDIRTGRPGSNKTSKPVDCV